LGHGTGPPSEQQEAARVPIIQRSTQKNHVMTGEMLKALSAPAYRTTRVYRRLLPEGHRYYWTIYISGHLSQVPGVPISTRRYAR
jgi:hypothetical protein